MLYTYTLKTAENTFYAITASLQDAIAKSRVEDGIAVIYCPHTTAGITINESYDLDVVTDAMLGLELAFPDRKEFLHGEGNSSAHLKASAIGSSATVIINDGAALLGMWQGVYFCEFDGPRSRKYYVKVL